MLNHTKIALLGAGFTRNWGGWLASELAGELCGRVGNDDVLLQRLKVTRNFEQVLGELRQDANRGITERSRFERLQSAVLNTFNEMNQFLATRTFELNIRDESHWIAHFLATFDAIFSLNQDLFLEMHYVPGALPAGRRRWLGTCYPGVSLPKGWNNILPAERLAHVLALDPNAAEEPSYQPIYKLHGSVNWRAADDSPIVVIGDGKEAAITGNPILAATFKKFNEYLLAGNTRLMAIGYSFGDQHVNGLLMNASIRAGLRTYLVNPAGLSIFDPPSNAAIKKTAELFEAIRPAGVSTRPFRDAFIDDELSFNSFQRFLTVED